MASHTASESTSTVDRARNVTRSHDENGARSVARDGVDLLKENPVLTLVAVGVVGFAIGTLAGRSSVRRRGTLDANWDSVQRAIDAARSGASDTVGGWAKTLKSEGLWPEQIPGRVKRQINRLLQSVPR